MSLRPPATGTEAYLAAILDELRALRVAVEGGGPEQGPTEAAADVPADPAPTRRTRTRTRG